MIKVGIIDDHRLYTDGLSSILEMQREVSEVCMLNDPGKGADWLHREKPEVVLLDVMMPEVNGLELIPELTEYGVKIIMVSSRSDRSLIQRSMAAGAHGFCSKNIDVRQLITAIVEVIDGKAFIDPSLIDLRTTRSSKVPHLSKREKEVLQYLSQGHSSKQIAEVLFITEHTVNSHRKSLLRKFECNTTAQMLNQMVILGDS